MLSEYFCKTLDYLVQTGSAAEIGLTLNTNGTVLNERVLANFRHFKHVVVSVSIDGFGKLNSYIRHHSNWVQIEKNVTKLKQMESDCIRIGVGPTVQAYNSLYLADLFEWMEKNKLPLFTHDILTQPQILGVGILPSHVKEFAAQKLRKYALDCRPAFAEMVVQISNRIADSADDCTEENLLLFLRFTADLDTLRNQDFKEVCPELHDMIRSYVQQTM